LQRHSLKLSETNSFRSFRQEWNTFE